MMAAITLASASQIRAELLHHAGVPVAVQTSGVDEATIKAALLHEGAGARDIADALAEAKAVKGSLRCEGIVIGADSTLEFKGVLYDKPQDLAEARIHLNTLKGGRHRLHCAAVVAVSGAPIWRHVGTSTLQMRDFSAEFLDRYIDHEGSSLLSSVGGYRLEGMGAQLFSHIEGDYFSILGLPLLPLLDFLRTQGVLGS